MNRFRKRSDAKRPTQLQSPVYYTESAYEPDLLQQETLPELPLASDFRASLILTDLSRRFTLLGASPQESVSVDALRSRLADQRTRGAENQISEEEEDMIMETLGLRPAARSDAEDEYHSSVSTRSALSGSSSTASSKRYSNNLFGSGRFRDYSYMRSVSSMQSKTASMRTTDSTRSYTASVDSMRPVTPETVSPSGPEALSVRSAPLVPSAPYGGQPLSVAEYRLSKSLGPSALRRASLALEEAIKSIEEEGEDEILMPRSGPRGSLDTQRPSLESREADASRTSGVYEAGTAISSDKHTSLEPESPRSSPIPSRTVPGYIPGMPRPMTPRDAVEMDDQRCYSTTPRASSPNLVSPSPMSPSSLSSSLIRRDSNASPSRQSPRPSSPNVISPMFIQRTPNGRYTPEGSEPAFSGDFEGSQNSSVVGRRRPASPLSSNTYQPLAVPARPGTPSHVTWVPGSNGSSRPGHTRDPSWISDSSESPTRSLRSPALPDSPLIGPGHATINSFSSSFSSTSSFESRPLSPMDLGSPSLSTNRALRSPTPTQVANRSPTSGTFSDKSGSRRSSKQNPPSSQFTLGPFQPLVFSPIANSSRSSLESVGSSYHSWDGDQKDRTATLFSDADPQKPLWHDVLQIGEIPTDSSNSSPDDWEAEDVIMKYAGLKKVDFLAIQDKLVGAAIAKISPDVPHRVPSLRRRRPSTSQSNYSLNGRIASPPQSPTTAAPVATDQYSALLNSVVDSLQSSASPNASISVDVPGVGSQAEDISPTTRRNRDLAQVLFGQQEIEDEQPHHLTISVPPNDSNGHVPNSAPLNSSFPMHSPYEVPASSASANWPYQPLRNPSTPKLPSTPLEHAELAREVQRKADAAMVALQKHPSSSNLALSPKTSVAPRKRISPNQISTPQLVSASTSVDTIPLPSPAPSVTGGQSKIGSRLKRLRGSLRTKPMLPTAEDLTPFPMELRSPPPVQTVRYDPARFHPAGEPIAVSATEVEGFRVPVPSPPASAGPGLKGFMNRLRGKPRVNEMQAEFDNHGSYGRSPNLPPLNFGPSSPESSSAQPPLTMQPRSPPSSASTPTLHSMPLSSARSPTLPLYSPRHQGTPSTEAPDATVAHESQAIKQLFDAASNLGLDQGALSDLLARSGSTSSRSTGWTLLTRNNSTVASASRPDSAQSGEPSRSNSHRSIVPKKVPEGPSQPDHLRRPREGAADKNAVVRRTIIYPSESRASTIDLSVLIRKQSSRRKRASATSVSSRSVHDRVPTPPPPRAATGKRFSTDMASSPVPHLPAATTPLQTDRLMVAPAGPVEKSYDSLYEMYSGEKAAGPSTEAPQGAPPVPEPGQAVEVIEYANGETIWSIVNGLRDEDDELDGYASRASFASDYSVREGGEGVQVFFKEHGRKGSTSSFLSRKKTASKSRPETKVFYSSSAQIGRLIENMSQGMEAGSFNILPNHPTGRSTTSSLSEADMTVEERLEHMLHGLR